MVILLAIVLISICIVSIGIQSVDNMSYIFDRMLIVIAIGILVCVIVLCSVYIYVIKFASASATAIVPCAKNENSIWDFKVLELEESLQELKDKLFNQLSNNEIKTNKLETELKKHTVDLIGMQWKIKALEHLQQKFKTEVSSSAKKAIHLVEELEEGLQKLTGKLSHNDVKIDNLGDKQQNFKEIVADILVAILQNIKDELSSSTSKVNKVEELQKCKEEISKSSIKELQNTTDIVEENLTPTTDIPKIENPEFELTRNYSNTLRDTGNREKEGYYYFTANAEAVNITFKRPTAIIIYNRTIPIKHLNEILIQIVKYAFEINKEKLREMAEMEWRVYKKPILAKCRRHIWQPKRAKEIEKDRIYLDTSLSGEDIWNISKIILKEFNIPADRIMVYLIERDTYCNCI